MSDLSVLRGILGDRCDDVIEDAARAMQEGCGSWPWERMCSEMPAWADEWRRNATHALAAVLPDLLAAAWDRGYHMGLADTIDDLAGATTPRTRNPYRAPLPTPDAPQAPGDAGSPGDALGDTPAPDRAAAGIVTTAHYCRCATLGLVCGHSGRMDACATAPDPTRTPPF